MSEHARQLPTILLQLLPADHSTVGNITLWAQFQAATQAAGITGVSEEAFKAAREALVTSGQAVKGRGRGGSTARATGPSRPDFDLQAEPTTPDLLATSPNAAPAKSKTTGKPKVATQPIPPDGSEVLAYRHQDRRKNNPEVGLVNASSDPEQAKTPWAYDPHLDPALQFDSARAGAEKLIEDALAGNDPAAMRHALEELRRMSAPYLQWTGKAERTSFEVDTVSLHVHERIDAMSILSAVSKRHGKKDDKSTTAGVQPGLFEAPFESMPLRSAIDFYKHDRGWANRLVAGDSLLVMNSLLQKESMAGQVQMIYIDPPYGIKYGSNFQPFTNKRDVKDRSDADLTQEPEMIKAFRDTWELGIHSYLTYLRDRLLLAKDLLSETGSVFVQISDENLHLVRNLMDEIFDKKNFIAQIAYVTTSTQGTGLIPVVNDNILWYGQDRSKTKYNQCYELKAQDGLGSSGYNWVRLPTGEMKRLATASDQDCAQGSVFAASDLTSSHQSLSEPIEFRGTTFESGARYWSTSTKGMNRLSKANRLLSSGNSLRYLRFFKDFSAFPRTNVWTDTGVAGFTSTRKTFVVQTNEKVIERCMLMTTDPGDLVLDPTCGGGYDRLRR